MVRKTSTLPNVNNRTWGLVLLALISQHASVLAKDGYKDTSWMESFKTPVFRNEEIRLVTVYPQMQGKGSIYATGLDGLEHNRIEVSNTVIASANSYNTLSKFGLLGYRQKEGPQKGITLVNLVTSNRTLVSNQKHHGFHLDRNGSSIAIGYGSKFEFRYMTDLKYIIDFDSNKFDAMGVRGGLDAVVGDQIILNDRHESMAVFVNLRLIDPENETVRKLDLPKAYGKYRISDDLKYLLLTTFGHVPDDYEFAGGESAFNNKDVSNRIILFSINDNRVLHTFEPKIDNAGILCIRVDALRERLVFSSSFWRGSGVWELNPRTGETKKIIEGKAELLDVLPSGDVIYTKDSNIRLYSVTDQKDEIILEFEKGLREHLGFKYLGWYGNSNIEKR